MVAQTQQDNKAICPVLQKYLDRIQHVLVKETSDPNAYFAPSLTKKQKKELNKVAYKTCSKGAPSPPPH